MRRGRGLVTAGFILDVLTAAAIAVAVSAVGAWLFDATITDLLDGALLSGALVGWLMNHRRRITAEDAANSAIEHALRLDGECAHLTTENKALKVENDVLAGALADETKAAE